MSQARQLVLHVLVALTLLHLHVAVLVPPLTHGLLCLRADGV